MATNRTNVVFKNNAAGSVLSLLFVFLMATGCSPAAPVPTSTPEPTVPPSATPLVSEADLLTVCEDDVALEAAAEYNPTNGSISPLISFVRENATTADYMRSAAFIAPRWDNVDSLEEVQLVACITKEEQEVDEVCSYTGGKKLNLVRIRYQIVVKSTHTGERVASVAVTEVAHEDECPLVYEFPEDKLTVHSLPDPDKTLKFLKIYAEPK